jgi:type VI secretion system secreted protein Hcp
VPFAEEYLMKVNGVVGESSDAKHKGAIELTSWSWGLSQSGAAHAASGGGESGRAEVQDLLITMPASKASPRLMLSCASGEHHKDAVLTVRKAGRPQQEFLVIKMEDVIITSVQTGGSAPSGDLVDQVALGFSTVRMEFRPQKDDGSLDVAVEAGWDITNNKPL